MSSQIEICNMALSRLGASRIISLSDNTVEAKNLSAIYDQVAKYTMSMGPWPSTKIRTTLAQLTSTPAYGFTYFYQLPTIPKCLRVLEINECRIGDINYKIEGDKLLTNEISVGILYIGFIQDTEQYDVYLEQAIVSGLIVELAYSRTGQYQVEDTFVKYHEGKIAELLNIACVQGSNDTLPSDTFTDVRREG